MTGDDYLFSRNGPPDPDVQRLEALLSPLKHRGGLAPEGLAQAVRSRWSSSALLGAGLLGLAASLLVVVLAVREELGAGTPGLAQPSAPSPVLRVVDTGQRLEERAWVETQASSTELLLGEVGRVRLDPGSRLEVRRLGHDETRLYLERGRLEARVSADARPRFFQVETPSTRCVDLGCRYTLEVDGAGDARVVVVTGQVAFENEGREVYVPAGATCSATRDAGAGTPHFENAPAELVVALVAFDQGTREPPSRRRALALAVLAATRAERDALSAWHLLADPDASIARAARARLIEVAQGAPEGVAAESLAAPDAAERARWKDRLRSAWW